MKDALRNLITLRYFAPSLSERLFFIFGCQRSGTTLLLSILSAHPNIVGTDETEFASPYPFPSAQRLAFHRLTGKYACFKMLEHSNKLDFLTTFYPNAKVLWPIRNPYSTLSSMLNLTNAKGSWINRCAKLELKRIRPFFPEVFANLQISDLSAIEKASLYWACKNQYPALLQAQGFPVLVFQYENLLEDQKNTLTSIVKFLGLDWSDDLLNFYQKNPGKSLAGGTRTNLPINRDRASQLQSHFSQADVERIQQICEPVMKTYGYTMPEMYDRSS